MRKSDWKEGLEIPKPPKGITHAQIRCDKKKSMVAVENFDTFRGIEGMVCWGKQKKNRKTIELIGEEFFWDGFKVE